MNKNAYPRNKNAYPRNEYKSKKEAWSMSITMEPCDKQISQ
uniref:Uncharacterized protein n=1 Tax=viral metagenome TaxID=1070528 RepID=A0A6C0C021_9ZZZZ